MRYLRIIVVITICIASLLSIGFIFWQQELQYTLPTPQPVNYQPVSPGKKIDLNLAVFGSSSKPKHLHFFNPACPCSRFNKEHFESLFRTYRDRVDFWIILPSAEELEEVKDLFDDQVPVLVDDNGSIADGCGVYSSPQAALITEDGYLYYRGNYNKSRYCTDVATNYAQQAIDSLLARHEPPAFGLLSTTSYGCELSRREEAFPFGF